MPPLSITDQLARAAVRPPSTVTYLTGPQVKARYQCSYQTIWRWMNDPDLGFPQPLKIGKRNRFQLEELQAWEIRQVGASLTPPPLP